MDGAMQRRAKLRKKTDCTRTQEEKSLGRRPRVARLKNVRLNIEHNQLGTIVGIYYNSKFFGLGITSSVTARNYSSELGFTVISFRALRAWAQLFGL